MNSGKTRRTLHTDEEVARARRNISEHAEAKAVADEIIRAADAWRERSDEWLARLITPPAVPRAFNISFSGCPVHGREVFKHGNYSFAVDLDRPFKVRCPVGGEEYPSNDFRAFLDSGLKDRSLLTGDYPDDGRGWRKPGEGKKYWFVAYYNHWAWLNHIVPMTHSLSRAYLLTGDRHYARQTIILLDRIADVYPGMDHNKQSRYAEEFAPDYTGKIVNCIWETGLATRLAEAYDNVFDAINRTADAQRFLGKTAAAIRGHIESNLLHDIVDAVYRGSIRGNYGYHQETLLTTVLVAQREVEQVADRLVNASDPSFHLQGARYALANGMSRDGVCTRETAPGYSFIWPTQLTKVAELLRLAGVNLYREPSMRHLYLGPPRMIVHGGFTPAIGDSGGVTGTAITIPPWLTRIAIREYGPDFFDALPGVEPVPAPGFLSYEDLFGEPAETIPAPAPSFPRRSDNLSGYGLAVLRGRDAAHPADLSLFYGTAAGHGHPDRLNIELFALGRKVLPDLGYPQFAADDPEPPGWSANTVSHNTVVVNAKRQTTHECGQVRSFASSPTVQLVEVDAPAAYRGEVDLYRRTVALVDTAAGPYVLDVFRIVGGHQHDYSLHGPEGEFEAGIALSPPQTEGTLAGPQVPLANLYDDPRRSAPGYAGPFYGYVGSGFSFLTNVQRGEPRAPWSAHWTLPQDAGHLRITWLPLQPQEVFVCDGTPPLRPGNPERLKYVLSRRGNVDEPSQEPLRSVFVSILEPYQEHPTLTGARHMSVTQGDDLSVAALMQTAAGDDYVASSPDGGRLTADAAATFPGQPGLDFQGAFGVLSLRAGELQRAFLCGPGHIAVAGTGLTCGEGLTGHVVAVDYGSRSVTVAPQTNGVSLPALGGSTVVLAGGGRSTSWAIADAAATDDGNILLRLEDLDPQMALIVVSDSEPGRIKTPTALHLAHMRFYEGMAAADGMGRTLGRVKSVADGWVTFDQPDAMPTENDEGETVVRLFDFGVGDTVEVKPVAHVQAIAPGHYRLEATSAVELCIPAPDGATASWHPQAGSARRIETRREGGSACLSVSSADLAGGVGELRVFRSRGDEPAQSTGS